MSLAESLQGPINAYAQSRNILPILGKRCRAKNQKFQHQNRIFFFIQKSRLFNHSRRTQINFWDHVFWNQAKIV